MFCAYPLNIWKIRKDQDIAPLYPLHFLLFADFSSFQQWWKEVEGRFTLIWLEAP